jgi:Protein of unknown function (DUF3313)
MNRILTLLLACTAAASINPALAASNMDGLQEVQVRGFDSAHAAPGVSLAAYTKVRMEPVAVEFDKDFKPMRVGSHTKLDSAELEDIRAAVANLVHEEFTKSLQRGSYEVVEAAGPDVLLVRARIVDLVVNAPDTMEAGRNSSFTESAAEMTLVLELSDSVTGQVIVRAEDREETLETGQLNRTTSVNNEADARLLVQNWARLLRSRLDAARHVGR